VRASAPSGTYWANLATRLTALTITPIAHRMGKQGN
jgi:hypothetical protein